jgi:hypothetical protein
MALHDYKCRICDHVQRDRLYSVKTGIPRHIKCSECGTLKGAIQVFTFGRPVSNTGSMYNQMEPHPQFGFPITSYSHKQEVKEKYGVQEISDPVGGNRKPSEDDYDDQPLPDDAAGGVEWGGTGIVDDPSIRKKELKGVSLAGREEDE